MQQLTPQQVQEAQRIAQALAAGYTPEQLGYSESDIMSLGASLQAQASGGAASAPMQPAAPLAKYGGVQSPNIRTAGHPGSREEAATRSLLQGLLANPYAMQSFPQVQAYLNNGLTEDWSAEDYPFNNTTIQQDQLREQFGLTSPADVTQEALDAQRERNQDAYFQPVGLSPPVNQIGTPLGPFNPQSINFAQQQQLTPQQAQDAAVIERALEFGINPELLGFTDADLVSLGISPQAAAERMGITPPTPPPQMQPPAPPTVMDGVQQRIGSAWDAAQAPPEAPQGAWSGALPPAPPLADTPPLAAPGAWNAPDAIAPGLETTDAGFPAADINAMAVAILGEARNEGYEGQLGVAHVINNRAQVAGITPSEVVRMTSPEGSQFSFNDDANLSPAIAAAKNGTEAFQRAVAIATSVLSGQSADPTGGATYYHADYTNPPWAKDFDQTTQIGKHLYYGGDQATKEFQYIAANSAVIPEYALNPDLALNQEAILQQQGFAAPTPPSPPPAAPAAPQVPLGASPYDRPSIDSLLPYIDPLPTPSAPAYPMPSPAATPLGAPPSASPAYGRSPLSSASSPVLAALGASPSASPLAQSSPAAGALASQLAGAVASPMAQPVPSAPAAPTAPSTSGAGFPAPLPSAPAGPLAPRELATGPTSGSLSQLPSPLAGPATPTPGLAPTQSPFASPVPSPGVAQMQPPAPPPSADPAVTDFAQYYADNPAAANSPTTSISSPPASPLDRIGMGMAQDPTVGPFGIPAMREAQAIDAMRAQPPPTVTAAAYPLENLQSTGSLPPAAMALGPVTGGALPAPTMPVATGAIPQMALGPVTGGALPAPTMPTAAGSLPSEIATPITDFAQYYADNPAAANPVPSPAAVPLASAAPARIENAFADTGALIDARLEQAAEEQALQPTPLTPPTPAAPVASAPAVPLGPSAPALPGLPSAPAEIAALTSDFAAPVPFSTQGPAPPVEGPTAFLTSPEANPAYAPTTPAPVPAAPIVAPTLTPSALVTAGFDPISPEFDLPPTPPAPPLVAVPESTAPAAAPAMAAPDNIPIVTPTPPAPAPAPAPTPAPTSSPATPTPMPNPVPAPAIPAAPPIQTVEPALPNLSIPAGAIGDITLTGPELTPAPAPAPAPMTPPAPPAPQTAPVAPDFGEISMPSFDFDGYARAHNMTAAGLESLIDSGMHDYIMQDMIAKSFASPPGAFTSAASQAGGGGLFGGLFGGLGSGGSSGGYGGYGGYGSYGGSAYGGMSGGYGGYGNQASYANYGR